MPKRLILLLDGTWNNADAGDNDTNIVRLEDGIIRYLRRRALEKHLEEGPLAAAREGSEKVRAFETNGMDNYVYYQRGVGTGAMDAFRGGIFGKGLSDNIRRAYNFLSYNYDPGDQIFIFGFSRGAYTARSVVGYIHSAGLLTRTDCTAENEWRVWNYYRTLPADRMPGDWAALTPIVHDRKALRISCIGVFDTVGSLGVPLDLFNKRNLESYGFHDVTLGSITDVNLHAMAIDELRRPFGATLWRRPRFKDYDTRTEQVWFSGVHSDIGGGYVSAEARKNGGAMSLDDITFDWMVKRLKHHYPDFPVDLHGSFDTEKWVEARQHNSRRLYYKVLKLAYRTMANLPLPRTKLRFWQTLASFDRRDEPIGESVHISALERLGRQVPMGRSCKTYSPPNLLRILPVIEMTYAGTNRGPKVLVVDWNGAPIDSADPWCAWRVELLLEAARKRLALTRTGRRRSRAWDQTFEAQAAGH